MRLFRLAIAPLLLIAAVVYNGSGGGETKVRYERASYTLPTPWKALRAESAATVQYWLAVERWSEAQDRAEWFAEAERQAAQREAERTRRPQSAPRPYRVATTRTGNCGGWESSVASLWPANEVGNACRRLMCESGGNPSARNPSGAVGLMQLLGHGGTTDPMQNLTVAFHLWESSGWSPWVCR